MRSPFARVLLAAACSLSAVADARADAPRPEQIVRVLGARTASVYAPRTGTVGALVALPKGVSAQSLGLEPVTPSIARLRAAPEVVARFSETHPSLRVEVGPTLKLLNDRVGRFVRVHEAAATRGADGEGAWVGVADTGIDADHPDMLDEAGRTRIAWVLDLSKPPAGG